MPRRYSDSDHRPVTPGELDNLSAQMEWAETAGMFNGMFKGDIVAPVQLTKENLLQSIEPEMRLFKSFFMKIYGYGISYPSFANQALDKLEAAGCSKAQEYYDRFVSEYEEQARKDMREAAEWYMNRRKDDVRVKKKDSKGVAAWKILSKAELKELLNQLLLKGIITSPEQFLTLANSDQ